MAIEMLSGVAVGGPRDGVKVEAPANWSGRVRKPNHTGVQNKDFYPGYYQWDYVEVIDGYTWVWHWYRPEPNQKRKPTKM